MLKFAKVTLVRKCILTLHLMQDSTIVPESLNSCSFSQEVVKGFKDVLETAPAVQALVFMRGKKGGHAHAQ